MYITMSLHFSTGGVVKANFAEGFGLQNQEAVDEAVRR